VETPIVPPFPKISAENIQKIIVFVKKCKKIPTLPKTNIILFPKIAPNLPKIWQKQNERKIRYEQQNFKNTK
jgi:hypothetical protein